MPWAGKLWSTTYTSHDLGRGNDKHFAILEARQIIDATGDGDIAHWAGCPAIKSTPLIALTMHFKDPREAAFLAILSRRPTAAESARLAESDLNALIYALLNTKQFLFIQ